MIKELIEMQRELDKSFLEANGLESVELERYYYAILSEVGELNQELKARWQWWKKTQAPVNEEKTLEELVDVFHFALSILGKSHNDASLINFDISIDNFEDISYEASEYKTMELYQVVLTCVADIVEYNPPKEYRNLLKFMIMLTFKLGFTMEQVYNAYITKNKENYERIKNNY